MTLDCYVSKNKLAKSRGEFMGKHGKFSQKEVTKIESHSQLETEAPQRACCTSAVADMSSHSSAQSADTAANTVFSLVADQDLCGQNILLHHN